MVEGEGGATLLQLINAGFRRQARRSHTRGTENTCEEKMMGTNRYSAMANVAAASLAALVVASSPGSLGAATQQGSAESKPLAAAPKPPKPGPEMEKLAFLLGTWTFTEKYEKSPLIPNGGEGSGMYKAVTGPGGFSILADFTSSGPDGDESGHGIYTWEPKENSYKAYFFGNKFAGSFVVTGQWEGGNLVLAGDFLMEGKKVSFKEVYSDITPRFLTIVESVSVDGGPYHLFAATKATKKLGP